MDAPTLTTPRLILRPFTAADGEALHRVFAQEGVMRYFPRPEAPPRAAVDRFIADQLRRWSEDGFGLWGVEWPATGELIGWIGLQNLPETHEVEVGYLLAPAYWGRGLATEGARASLHYGFEVLRLAQVVAIVHRENAASQRVAHKLGMRMDREAVYWGMPAYHYVLERPPCRAMRCAYEGAGAVGEGSAR